MTRTTRTPCAAANCPTLGGLHHITIRPHDHPDGDFALYCLVFLTHDRMELVHHAVTAHPTAEWVARQMTEAFPRDTAPKYLVRDRDAVYGHVVRRRPRAVASGSTNCTTLALATHT